MLARSLHHDTTHEAFYVSHSIIYVYLMATERSVCNVSTGTYGKHILLLFLRHVTPKVLVYNRPRGTACFNLNFSCSRVTLMWLYSLYGFRHESIPECFCRFINRVILIHYLLRDNSSQPSLKYQSGVDRRSSVTESFLFFVSLNFPHILYLPCWY